MDKCKTSEKDGWDIMFLQKVTVQDIQLRTDDLLHITQRELKRASDFCGVNFEVYMSTTDHVKYTHFVCTSGPSKCDSSRHDISISVLCAIRWYSRWKATTSIGFNPWPAPHLSHLFQCQSLRASVQSGLSHESVCYYAKAGLDRSPLKCRSWKRDQGPSGRWASRCCHCRYHNRSPLSPQTTRARTSSLCAHSTWRGWSVLLWKDRRNCLLCSFLKTCQTGLAEFDGFSFN